MALQRRTPERPKAGSERTVGRPAPYPDDRRGLEHARHMLHGLGRPDGQVRFLRRSNSASVGCSNSNEPVTTGPPRTYLLIVTPDPDTWELMSFKAAGEAPGAIFVVSDWGLAPQLYAHSNGARRFLWDALWDPRPPEFATTLADRWGKRRLYLVRLAAVGPARPERVRELERSIAGDPRWREVPPPDSARGFGVVVLRAYERIEG